jgi:hypothetical protein
MNSLISKHRKARNLAGFYYRCYGFQSTFSTPPSATLFKWRLHFLPDDFSVGDFKWVDHIFGVMNINHCNLHDYIWFSFLFIF